MQLKTDILLRRWPLVYLLVTFAAASGVNIVSVHPAQAITGPSLVWSKNVPGHIVQSSPSAIDLNGDGTKDVVVGAWDSKVYGLRGDTGNAATGWPVTTTHAVDSSAAVGDVTGDGNPELFIGSGDASSTCAGGGMYSFNRDGSQRFRFLAYDPVSVGGNSPCYDLAIHGSPALADVNFDNRADIITTSLGVNSFVLDALSGTLNWAWPFRWDDTQFSSPAVGDLNNDGKPDIVISGDSSVGGIVNHRGGLVRAISGTGQELWRFYTNEALYSSPVIGDVDGDGFPEVVVGAGDFYANNGGSNDSNKVFVLNRFGQVKWARDLGAHTLASPTLADFNGDSILDIGIGTWQGANAGKIFAMNGATGADLPGYPRASGGNLVIGQLSTADFDADGGQDIVAATGGGVYAYSGKTGALLFTVKNFGSFQNAPYIGDLDGNGKLDVVIAGSPDNVTGVVERYEMPTSTAVLGSNGWPKFRKDDAQTGSWLSAPLQNPGAFALRSQLLADQTVQVGDSLVSPNGQHALIVQPDGNLALRRNLVNIPWASHSGGTPKQLMMQSDGNLVLYNMANNPIWFSGTGGNPSAKVIMQDDGNMVIYNASNAPIWQTGSSNPQWNTYVNNTMYGGEMQTFQGLRSADGRYHLDAQKDGNFVLYGPVHALWQSGSGGKQQSRLALQSDGNMVVYGWNNFPLWQSGTNQRDKLILQDDGNLVLYNGAMQPLWWSGTGGQL